MGQKTKIEWCDHTFNPWIGCQKVSPGCANCYAEVSPPARISRGKSLPLWGPPATASRQIASESMWAQPLKWNKAAARYVVVDHSGIRVQHRPRVFCASLADVFEDWTGPMVTSHGDYLYCDPDGSNWEAMCHHPDDAEDQLDPRESRPLRLSDVRQRFCVLCNETLNLDYLLLTKRPENVTRMVPRQWLEAWPANVWLGTSIENRDYLDRIDHLRKVPAAVRFLSVEPLLGPLGKIDLTGIHWVIVGGESGSHCRECHINWIRDIIDQCRKAGVACFVKQLGSHSIGEQQHSVDEFSDVLLELRDRKGGEMSEWPEDLRVREWPKAGAA